MVISPNSTIADLLETLSKRVTRGMTAEETARYIEVASHCSLFRVDELAALPEPTPIGDLDFKPFEDQTLRHLMFHGHVHVDHCSSTGNPSK